MIKNTLVLFFAFISVKPDLPIQNTYFLAKDYRVTINGTSNLRDWKETVEKVSGDMVAILNHDGSVNLVSVDIRMDVNSIKSDMGSIMNNKTYAALKSNINPEIIFTLNVPVKLVQVNRGENRFTLKGNLTLAGFCKSVTMEVNLFILGEGRLQFEGTEAIKMTDFGVKPPSALFGTMKASPDIIINFETNFTNKQKQS
jgi:polyisoprenoid-binding protein YceI